MDSVKGKITNIIFFILLFIVTVSALIFGLTHYKNKRKEIRDERYHHLQTISLLKINQLVQWNKERLSEVNFFSGNLPYSHYVRQINEGSEQARSNLREVLKQIMTFKRYENILILDKSGKLLFSVDSTVIAIDSFLVVSSKKVFDSKDVLIIDFYKCDFHHTMHFDFISPVFNVDGSVIATMIFKINPNDYLYQVIQEWPTPGKTAETYILKIVEDTIYYLNNLRHSTKIKHNKGVAIKESDKISAKAALGFQGIVEDFGYRGKKVLADIRNVPGTSWYMVSQVDNDEIYDDLHKQSVYFWVFMILSVLLVGFIAIWIYHFRQRNFYKELYNNSIRLKKNLKESEEYQRSIISCIPIPLLGINMDGTLQIWNKAAEDVFGWKANEVIGKPVPFVPVEMKKEFDMFRQIISKGEIISGREIIRRKKNGEEVNVMLYAAPVYDHQKNVIAIMATLEDITQRKKTEEFNRSSFALLKMAGDSARFGGWSFNLLTNKLIWSDVVNSIHELPASYSPDINDAAKYIAPEWVRKITEAFDLCKERGMPFNEELEIITAKGNRIWVRVIGEAIKNEKEEIIKIQGAFQDINQMKLAEKNQEESSQALTRLIDNLSGIAYRCKYSPDRDMEFISHGCVKITGFSDQEFYNRSVSWSSLLFDEDRERILQEITENIKKRQSFQFEYRIRHKSGTEHLLWEKGIGIFDKNFNAIAVEGIITDITEQRETKDALNESLKNYRELIDGMIETVWVIDFDGNIIDVNKAAIKELGYTKEELCSIGLIGLDSSLKKEDIDLLIKSIPEDKIQIFETSHRTKEGKVIPVEISSSLVNYQGQKAILSIARNITIRRRNEKIQQILVEIARTSSRADAIDDLLIIVRNELTKVIDTANFYVALYNPKSDTLSKLNFTDDNKENIEWKTDNSLQGYILKTGKSLLLTSEEINLFIKEHNFELSDKQIKSILGVPLMVNDYCLGVMVIESYGIANPFDNDCVKLMEMIAYEMAIVLKRMNMIKDLIHAKEKAEESDRLKMAFLANISHEIRTPMNGILGFLDLMRKPDLNESKKEKFINIMNESGQRLLETINNIVEVSKIESRHTDIHLSEINISEVIQYHYILHKKSVVSRGIDFRITDKASEIFPVIKSDRYKIDGILTNLINNAIKFTKSGFIEFGSYIEPDSIVFYVKDTGIGIPVEKQGVIFDRFVQNDVSITRHYEGLGLGLSIVKSYIELLNGQIWVDSEIGRGSTFYFSLPYLPVKEKRKEPQQKTITFESIQHKIKILIAEDDIVSYSFLETLFEKKQISLLHAFNGNEAVKMTRDNPDISLILMDIKMPELNGIEAVKLIREFNENIPVIAQTAYAFENEKVESIKAGFNDFITKPIHSDELMKIIQKYIQFEKKL